MGSPPDEAPGDAHDGERTIDRRVPEMDCPSCARKVTRSVDAVDGVADSRANAATGVLSVSVDDGVPVAAVDEAIREAGYAVVDGRGDGRDRGDDGRGDGDDHEHEPPNGSVWRGGRAKRTAVGGVLLAAGLVAEFGLDAPVVGTLLARPITVADLLLVAAAAVPGREIVRAGAVSARHRSLDMDLLMGTAMVAATTVGLFVEAATLAVLFSLAELLERDALDRARNSLRELMALSPDEATVRRGGTTERVPVDDVAVGETVLVEPGGRIPVDGVVTGGASAVDQSPITGESVPVEKSPGAEVFAGTIAENGALEIETTATAGERTISQVIDLVTDARAARTEREQFVDRFAGYYTPAVVVAALLAATVPPLAFGAPWLAWFRNAIALLVIACPCAFVISTPVTVVSAVTSAARNGVLVKGGRHLEGVGDVDAVALDKTGTLTTGELRVTDVVPLNGNDEADVLRCARGLETRSEHPVGDAIVARADAAAVGGSEAGDFEALAGKGVTGDLHGETHYAGKPGLFESLDFDLGHVHATDDALADAGRLCDREDCLDLLAGTIPDLEADGKTVVLVGTESELEGVIAVADTVRPGARRAVERLHDLGVERVVMLTGDNEGAARSVAGAVGVDGFRADLLPAEKVEAVRALRAEHGTVAMVGDGVNDAPALAAATVGVAMGAAGTDAAIETADVALLGDGLDRLPYLFELSRTATTVVRQNVWSSLGVKALLAAGVPLGFVNVALAVLAGDAGMTTVVTGNAMRLARLAPGDDA